MKSIVILISGRGSNLGAILDAGLSLKVAAVISNRPDARGLELAAAKGIPTVVVDHKAYANRAAFDAALLAAIEPFKLDAIVLAGFMRILGEAFIAAFPQRIINIHPSLLPAFPGLDTHQRALAAGVRFHGATVHFVTPALDHGPIIAQAVVPVLQDDSAESLAARVLAAEHRLFPQALRWFAEDRLQILDSGVVRIAGSNVTQESLSDCLEWSNPAFLLSP